MICRHCATLLKCVMPGILAIGVSGPSRVAAQQSPPAASAEKQPSFEVVSIKPSQPDDQRHSWNSSIDRVAIENYTLRRMIRRAYGLKSDSQVVGGPDWLDKQAYDISAKVDDAEVAKMRKMGGPELNEEFGLLLQSLLAERFQVKVSRGKRDVPVYALLVDKSGAKLTPSTAPLEAVGTKAERNHSLSTTNGHMTAIAISMDSLADDLTTMPESGDRVVLNRTGLSGDFDFKLDWAEDRGDGVPPDSPYPGLFTALQEQLGLKLESQKGSVEVVIVDAATRPTLDN